MHAMPPRITRNSDRPRASNRTMVDTQIPGPLAKSKTRSASSPPEDENHGYGKQATTNPLERIEGHTHRQWAGSRDKNLLGVRSRGNFFLDIAFYAITWTCSRHLGHLQPAPQSREPHLRKAGFSSKRTTSGLPV